MRGADLTAEEPKNDSLTLVERSGLCSVEGASPFET